jgi:2-C-methyl-D-erythritol 2,4-cyclodiphosphate synthase
VRVGFGYDVHRLREGRPMVLGGVEIPYHKGPVGHSDGDALVHAVIDALLGATALGDIGVHFPDDDERFAGISSLVLLREVERELRAHEFTVTNIDATVVLERPRLASHIAEMRGNLADTLGIRIDQVSVKATTSEGMGFVGSGDGVAAFAVATVDHG